MQLCAVWRLSVFTSRLLLVWRESSRLSTNKLPIVYRIVVMANFGCCYCDTPFDGNDSGVRLSSKVRRTSVTVAHVLSTYLNVQVSGSEQSLSICSPCYVNVTRLYAGAMKVKEATDSLSNSQKRVNIFTPQKPKRQRSSPSKDSPQKVHFRILYFPLIFKSFLKFMLKLLHS